jgi:hypothetical protein
MAHAGWVGLADVRAQCVYRGQPFAALRLAVLNPSPAFCIGVRVSALTRLGGYA